MPATLPQDRRLVLARPDLAAADLEGVVKARRFAHPEGLVCIRPSAAVRARPDISYEQITQLLFGEAFDVLEEKDGWAFGQAKRDRYAGYVETHALGPPVGLPTHWTSHLRTYAFTEPDVKSPMAGLISMNSLVVVEVAEGRFARVAGLGWVHHGHLRPIGEYRDDPAAVALEYLGAPYHWGGRESLGLDCSGLVPTSPARWPSSKDPRGQRFPPGRRTGRRYRSRPAEARRPGLLDRSYRDHGRRRSDRARQRPPHGHHDRAAGAGRRGRSRRQTRASRPATGESAVPRLLESERVRAAKPPTLSPNAL